MDAFRTHKEVISEYEDYLSSFIKIRDPRIKEYVEGNTIKKELLPPPLVQFNPAYEKKETFEDLLNEGIVNTDLLNAINIFPPFRHQVEAIRLGADKKGFVVTSGTGSGKSLTFLATIFNDILKQGPSKLKGIKAILVYPMNALINSQEEEIKKYAKRYEERTNKEFPISFAKYTGQEGSKERERARTTEPDIILTNYMMLELLMTRRSEAWFRESIKNNLNYLVYDELHTYRGRQGADVSMLNRRIQALAQKELVMIGTSATMASKGSPFEKKREVARVAETIFGKKYEINQIINEYLVTSTSGLKVTKDELIGSLTDEIDINGSENQFENNALANWIEVNIALKNNENILERGTPLSIEDMAFVLHKETNLDVKHIECKIEDLLRWAENINKTNRENGIYRTYMPYRLHQFISQTGTVSVTLDSRAKRYISSSIEPYLKVDGEDIQLFPVLFSRYSGYDFLKVELNFNNMRMLPANVEEEFANNKVKSTDKSLDDEDFKYGYVVLYENGDTWDTDFEEIAPETWFKANGKDLKPFYEMVLPRAIYFNKNGDFSFEAKGEYTLMGYFMPAPLRIDPTSSIIYDDSRVSDNTKLARLGSEGRSTATSIMSYAIVDSLIKQNESYKDQKLLSFTDNRQDASLQTGHFNDFYATVRLRSALYRALESQNLTTSNIGGEILKALNLKEKDYATNPSEIEELSNRKNTDTVSSLLLYRAFQDLKHGWRYTMPNLEQVSLLEIDYENLEKISTISSLFKGIEMVEQLEEVEVYGMLKNILDYFRNNFSFNHNFFDNISERENDMRSYLNSESPWSLWEKEKVDEATVMTIQSMPRTARGLYTKSIGIRSNLGKYLQRLRKEHDYDRLKTEEYEDWLSDILAVLVKGALLHPVSIKSFPDHKMYKLNADSIIWKRSSSESTKLDSIRYNFYNEMMEVTPNEYFRNLYKKDYSKLGKQLIAREHTGQIKSEERIEREDSFRKGDISTLYCSPTMELGIDISNLNIVHMRNVPPNAANYSQRSGRAGRSGQTALVFTYCSNRSPHDVHYFKNSEEMVAGVVNPPQIDLNNEELLLTHLNAFLLMHLSIEGLDTSVADILDLSDESNIKLKASVRESINSQIDKFKNQFADEFSKVVDIVSGDIKQSIWYSDKWIINEIERFLPRFNSSFRRWILLFENATHLRNKSQAIIDNHIIAAKSDEKRIAARQERFARNQIENLKNEKNKYASNSEFYIFRYLAAEGFLPGYNFTRLPVRVTLGRAYRDDVEVISRSRGMALSEFAPNNIVYHSGNKYRINRMMISSVEDSKEKILISNDTGYAFMNEEIQQANVDPITGVNLKGDKMNLVSNVLEMSESVGDSTDKITSQEEERNRLGYEVYTYFNYPKGIENARSVILKRGGEKLLQLFFNGATQIVKLNIKHKRSNEEGFLINKENGAWLTNTDLERDEKLQDVAEQVYLYTRDTADTLYIQPLGNIGTKPEDIISLSYALKRGVERLFLVEDSEIGVDTMGNPEKPNILIHEAAEGSLGVLSQLLDPVRMKEWFKESYIAMHFDPETREETDRGKNIPKASYEDLLSYYNQRHHSDLNRHDIKEILEFLMDCEIEIVQGDDRDREEQYKYLLDNYDKNSTTELKFIEYLYKNDIALPDVAQQNLKDFYISADFIYILNSASLYF